MPSTRYNRSTVDHRNKYLLTAVATGCAAPTVRVDRRMRRKQALPTSRGTRPGHPRAGIAVISAVEAARRLNTSPTTVCALVEHDELDGFWVVAGKVYRHYVYEPAAQEFCARHGQFPAARTRPRRRQSDPAGVGEAQQLRARVLTLEQAVRSQQIALEQQRVAFEKQGQALNLMEDAARLQHESTTAMHNAVNALSEIGATLGIPDFGPD